MGVRVYLNTEDKAELEKAAGVPAGTAQRFTEFSDAHHKAGTDAYDVYTQTHADEHLHLWSQFELFGWGKFTYPVKTVWGNAKGTEALDIFLTATNHLTFGDVMEATKLIAKHGVYWA